MENDEENGFREGEVNEVQGPDLVAFNRSKYD